MVQKMRLLSVEMVTDDETGLYEIGEFDFGIPVTTYDFLDDPKHGKRRRSQLAHFLHWMAVAIQRGELATWDHPKQPDCGKEAMDKEES